jgi:alkylhydroperoxidase family enzyme
VVIDPRAVADRHPDSTIRALARLTVDVTERPWALTGADLAAARAGGLDAGAILHAILQASLFGHFNRIADAVGVDADYPDSFGAPHLEPATPAYLCPGSAPDPDAVRPIELGARAGAADLLAAWRAHALDRDLPLTRRHRALIAHIVAVRLGDLSVKEAAPDTLLDHALADLADVVTLAPWRLGPAAFAPLRALGLADDAEVFDAVATASSCTVFSRIAVTLAALAR